MASESNHQALVEGAFFAALTTIIALVGLYMPPLYILTSLLTPLPLAVVVRRRDLKTGFMAMLVAGALLFMLFGRPVAVVLLIIQMGPLGLLLGLLFKNYVSAGFSVVIAGLFSAVLLVASLFFSFWLTGINPFIMGPEMAQAMDHVINTYKQAGILDQAGEKEARLLIENFIRYMNLLLPGILVMSSIISTFVTYLINRQVLLRLGYNVPALPPFSRWRFPWYSIWGIILGLSLVLAGDSPGRTLMSATGKNLLLVVGFIYTILGLSVASYFIKGWKIARPVKIIMVVMAFLYLPFMFSVLLTLGVLDTLVNTRRLSENDEEEGK